MAESIANIEKDININIMFKTAKTSPDLQNLSFNRLISKRSEDVLLKNLVPENIKAFCRIEVDAKRILADPDVLIRILWNLVSNAIQSMPQGGELTIKGQIEANDTVISVQDTGFGIPEELKANFSLH